MKRTTVMLTPREFAALQRVAQLTHRTQSDLIREAVRKLTMNVRLPGIPKPVNPLEGLPTREEAEAFILRNAGYSFERLAQELRVSPEEVPLILARHDARWRRIRAKHESSGNGL